MEFEKLFPSVGVGGVRRVSDVALLILSLDVAPVASLGLIHQSARLKDPGQCIRED